jgi:hypothetical protein
MLPHRFFGGQREEPKRPLKAFPALFSDRKSNEIVFVFIKHHVLCNRSFVFVLSEDVSWHGSQSFSHSVTSFPDDGLQFAQKSCWYIKKNGYQVAKGSGDLFQGVE